MTSLGLQFKISVQQAVIVILLVILLTGLRAFLIPFYFLLAILFWVIVPFRISRGLIFLIMTLGIAMVGGMLWTGEAFVSNAILSIYMNLTIIIILLVNPIKEKVSHHRKELLPFFIKVATTIMIVNNVIGIVQYVVNPFLPEVIKSAYSADSFIGLYGRHGNAMHGLAILNCLLLFYYTLRYLREKNSNNLILSVFFLVSFIMCFYGLGFILLAMAIIIFLVAVKGMFFRLIKVVPVIVLLLAMLYVISPKEFNYTHVNIMKAVKGISSKEFLQNMGSSRKMVMNYRYYQLYTADPSTFLFGTGPGTFNSRVSFLLNGEYSPGNLFEKVLGTSAPTYAKAYIYPLWGKKILALPWMDGTRNQPFSSMIAFLSEYGFLFSVLLIMLFIKKVRIILNSLKKRDTGPASLLSDFLLLFTIFVGLHLITDNLFEFTEMMVIVLLFKLIEIYGLHSATQRPSSP